MPTSIILFRLRSNSPIMLMPWWRSRNFSEIHSITMISVNDKINGVRHNTATCPIAIKCVYTHIYCTIIYPICCRAEIPLENRLWVISILMALSHHTTPCYRNIVKCVFLFLGDSEKAKFFSTSIECIIHKYVRQKQTNDARPGLEHSTLNH